MRGCCAFGHTSTAGRQTRCAAVSKTETLSFSVFLGSDHLPRQAREKEKKRKLNKNIAGVVVSKQPAQWDWSGPELVPGWESGPEVFLVVEPGPAKDTVSLRCARRNVFFACHYLKATETPILAKTGSGQTKGNVENKTCFCRHVAVVYVADPVDVDEEDSGAQNAQNCHAVFCFLKENDIICQDRLGTETEMKNLKRSGAFGA
jgi:hypothetical protein